MSGPAKGVATGCLVSLLVWLAVTCLVLGVVLWLGNR